MEATTSRRQSDCDQISANLQNILRTNQIIRSGYTLLVFIVVIYIFSNFDKLM